MSRDDRCASSAAPARTARCFLVEHLQHHVSAALRERITVGIAVDLLHDQQRAGAADSAPFRPAMLPTLPLWRASSREPEPRRRSHQRPPCRARTARVGSTLIETPARCSNSRGRVVDRTAEGPRFFARPGQTLGRFFLRFLFIIKALSAVRRRERSPVTRWVRSRGRRLRRGTFSDPHAGRGPR